MATRSFVRPGPSPLARVITLLVAMVVGGGGLVFVLAATGVVQLPWMARKDASAAKVEPKGVQVLLSARAIPAYTKITRDYIIDDKTGEYTYTYLPEEDARREGFQNFKQIYGRVLKADKPQGRAFTEQDFLPEGTLGGVTAGVPPGKRGCLIPAERIAGAHGLKLGDHVDILMSQPIEPHLGHTVATGDSTQVMPSPGATSGKLRRAGVFVIAQDAVVVQPLTVRQAPVLGALTPKDGKIPTRTVQEIILAVDPKESAALTQALAVDTEIYCVYRSGQPNDKTERTPDLLPPPARAQIEVIVGKKRETKTFAPSGPSKSMTNSAEESEGNAARPTPEQP